MNFYLNPSLSLILHLLGGLNAYILISDFLNIIHIKHIRI